MKTETKEAVESLKNVIDDALDDENIQSEEIPDATLPEPIKKTRSLKRNAYFVIGAIVSVLSVIGFIFTVVWTAGFVKDIIDNTKQKEEFAQFIYPVVITDPASFEDNQQISSDVIISAAIWDIILYGDKSKYPNEFGNMTVPQVDVELHATNIFGKGLNFNHRTVGDASLSFYYSPENKSYIVPDSPKYFPYSPLVEEIKKSGDVYSLKVGYISPSPEWLMASKKSSEPECDKYMEYVVKKTNNKYTLTAIKEIPQPSTNPQ